MRKWVVGVAALLLSACGGEVYPVPASEAYVKLEGMGTPDSLGGLPEALSTMSIRFESLPGDNAVQWLFSRNGADIGRLVARVAPDGDTSSNVTLDYVEGSAPDEGRNGQLRRLIQNELYALVAESIDSKLEDRPFDEAVQKRVQHQMYTKTVGVMMDDASASMDEHVQRMKQRERESAASSEASSYARTKPATDLSDYSQ